MVKSLEDRLVSLALDHELLVSEVNLKYEEIYHYVLVTHPPCNQKVYEEISYIRTRNWCKTLYNERHPKK